MKRTIVLLALLTGCSVHTSTAPADTDSGVISIVPSRTTATTGPTLPRVKIIVARGHGWDSSGLFGPVYAPGACHSKRVSGGILPDPKCTFGATDAAVTQANIGRTICATGYTAPIRPPRSITNSAKTESASEYRVTNAAGEYDHLIPLELGGASDTRNMWVEADGKIPNPKDAVESRLRLLVCHKVGVPGAYGEHACPGCPALSLADAQRLIATNWTIALRLAATLLH